MNSVRAAALIVIGASCGVTESRADEGGVSFWLPGQYASLTAVPQTPGWSFGVIYYHTQASADADKAFQLGSQLRLGVDATGDLTVLAPTYVFANPLLGGQASAGLGVAAGYVQGNADAILTGPGGNQVSGSLRDDRWGFGDLYPNVSLRWNQGVHSTTVVLSGDIPVGAYDADRLANLGIGHAAIDGSFGYTYFNPQTGYEFSALAGATYNYENDDTQYQNGIDGHIDWGWSKFLPTQMQVGIAGYVFQQLTGDDGEGATLGDFKSQVMGIGPQIGKLYPLWVMQAYFNVRGYYEFAASNRAEGWNVYVTFGLSPAAPQH
ncbi:MAG TPA: transporter [Steroidobacteraceae bacterium]|nr:transporter [Steroidobacteraceae bacterium]